MAERLSKLTGKALRQISLYAQGFAAEVTCALAQFPLNFQQAIVFCASLAAAGRAGFDLPHIERNGKIIVTGDLNQAMEAANLLAPEHLELCVDEPERLLPLVRNAGSVFMGRYCPESLGDYLAGPNHTLPTSGTARFSSPLGVDDFVKKTQYTYYTQAALAGTAADIAVFARAEGLEAHARAALIRVQEVE